MCWHVSIWGFQNRVCLSVPQEKKSPWLRQYQSYISNWYINGKVFTSTTPWKPKRLNYFFKKFRNWLNWILSVPEKRNCPGFVDISPTVPYISNWYINGKVFTSTTAWKPKRLNCFFKKVRNWWNWILSIPEKRNRPGFVDISNTLVIDTSMESSSRVLQHWNPKGWFFSKKVWNWLNWILSLPEKRNSPGFVDISPTLIIDTSMERYSRVLQHGNTNYFNFIKKKKVQNWIMTCILICAEVLNAP